MKTLSLTLKIIAALFFAGALFFSCSLEPFSQEEYGTLIINLSASGSSNARKIEIGDVQGTQFEKYFGTYVENLRFFIDVSGAAQAHREAKFSDPDIIFSLPAGSYDIDITVFNPANYDANIKNSVADFKKAAKVIIKKGETVKIDAIELKIPTIDYDLVELSLLPLNLPDIQGLIEPASSGSGVVFFTKPENIGPNTLTAISAKHTGAEIEPAAGVTKPLSSYIPGDIVVQSADEFQKNTYSLRWVNNMSRQWEKIDLYEGNHTPAWDQDYVHYYHLGVTAGRTYKIYWEGSAPDVEPKEVEIIGRASIKKDPNNFQPVQPAPPAPPIPLTSPLEVRAETNGYAYFKISNSDPVSMGWYKIKYEEVGAVLSAYPADPNTIKAIGSLSGNILSNTTIGEANKLTTINVDSHVTVATGATLTIRPGTTLNFTGNFSITVNGSLVTESFVTVDNPEGYMEDEYGNKYVVNEAYVPGRITMTRSSGNWGGITFNWSSSGNVLANVDISKADTGDANKSAIQIDGANADITNCVIDGGNANGGITLINGGVLTTFSENTIKNTGTAPIYSDSISNLENSIIGSIGPDKLGPVVPDNVFANNAKNYIHISGSIIAFNFNGFSSVAAMKNYGIPGYNLPWYLEQGLDIDDPGNNPELTIQAGTQVWVGAGKSIRVGQTAYAELYANGTSSEPIVFRGLNNASGEWAGIYIDVNGYAYLNYCDISGGGSGASFPENSCISVDAGAYAGLYNLNISKSDHYGIAYDTGFGTWINWSDINFTEIGADPDNVWNESIPMGYPDLTTDF